MEFAPNRGDVAVGAGDTKPLDLSLAVASLAEAVTVTAAATVIDTTSAKLGVNVSPEEVANLPVNGRNFANLMTLATGATTDGNGGWASVRFNGKSNQQNYLNYDGVDGTLRLGREPGLPERHRLAVPAADVDGIGRGVPRELRPRAGRKRSRRRRQHHRRQQERRQPVQRARVFEYLRNDALDSASKYDDQKQKLEMNQFGGSIGGPIASNRTFFFASYEGLKQTTGLSFTEAVPSDEAIRRIMAGEPVGSAPDRAPPARRRSRRCWQASRAAPSRPSNPLLALATLEHAGGAEGAQLFAPARPPLQQQPVVLRAPALQRRRGGHAGSHGDAAARSGDAAAAELRGQPPVDLRQRA